MEVHKVDLSAGYKIRDQHGIHFLTFQVVYWIDIFSREVYRELMIENLKYCIKHKGLKVHGYVIMSNHVHLILSSEGHKLSDVIRDLKGYTAKEIIRTIKDSEKTESRRDWLLNMFRYATGLKANSSECQLWTHENHPIQLQNQEMAVQKLNYIHQNPVRAGLVYRAEDYVYSSASAYCGEEKQIEISFLG
jgi:putative transposase